jgi:pilus assembly protein CpaB
MVWQTWPSTTTSGGFIRRSDRADANTELLGWIVRAPFVAGEPIREAKLVKADGSGFMAAILPIGSRAISTEISPETGAGGFILPNDRVDVILTRRVKDASHPDESDTVRAEVVLSNVRVLAIDQVPKEKEGTNNVVGRTVTLELKPAQTATLASSRQAGTLSLSLRSIADANQVEMSSNNDEHRRVGINVVRYGVTNPSTSMAK